LVGVNVIVGVRVIVGVKVIVGVTVKVDVSVAVDVLVRVGVNVGVSDGVVVSVGSIVPIVKSEVMLAKMQKQHKMKIPKKTKINLPARFCFLNVSFSQEMNLCACCII